MVTKSQQADFTPRFINASWTIQEGVDDDNPDLYYIGQMELLRLCEEYLKAWNGGPSHGFE